MPRVRRRSKVRRGQLSRFYVRRLIKPWFSDAAIREFIEQHPGCEADVADAFDTTLEKLQKRLTEVTDD
jgi:hypothetical protein